MELSQTEMRNTRSNIYYFLYTLNLKWFMDFQVEITTNQLEIQNDSNNSISIIY